MVGIITYYFVKGLGMGESFSFITYGVFVALCYVYGSIGGYVADKYLDTKRTIIVGAFIVSCSSCLNIGVNWCRNINLHSFNGCDKTITG